MLFQNIVPVRVFAHGDRVVVMKEVHERGGEIIETKFLMTTI
jgi:hypothetical protein